MSRVRGPATRLAALLLAFVMTGCLGTVLETPAKRGRPIGGNHVHILASPVRIDAHVCENGIARTSTFVPVWGVVVGILTIGIAVPKATFYECVEGR